MIDFGGNKDTYKVITQVNQYDANKPIPTDYDLYTKPIKMLMPEGLRDTLSVNT